MKNKIVWILGVLCVILIALSIIVLKREDRNKPEMRFDESFEYHENMSEEDLLKGVTAIDQEDGDISDQIVVDSVVKSNGKNYVKVYYAVVDSSGNGVRVGREIPYSEEENGAKEPADIEVTVAEETEAVPESMEEAAITTSSIQETDMVQETEAVPDGSEPPVLTMTTDQVTLAVGSTFVYQDYVESIVDDKDLEDDLFRELIIEGEYDIQTPGTYPLVFCTCDSNGNISNSVPFTLIIQ